MRHTRDHSHLEEEKKGSKKRDGAAEFMLSQDSIKQFEQAAEQETIEEREKLQSIEK
jgi:hypothetical protein